MFDIQGEHPINLILLTGNLIITFGIVSFVIKKRGRFQAMYGVDLEQKRDFYYQQDISKYLFFLLLFGSILVYSSEFMAVRLSFGMCGYFAYVFSIVILLIAIHSYLIREIKAKSKWLDEPDIKEIESSLIDTNVETKSYYNNLFFQNSMSVDIINSEKVLKEAKKYLIKKGKL